MKESRELRTISDVALRERRKRVAKRLPSAEDILRGSLVERYVTCGNPNCKCSRGERHGPIWYLTVTLGPGRTRGGVIPREMVAEVRRWIENYQTFKGQLEEISEINRELLRRQREQWRLRR